MPRLKILLLGQPRVELDGSPVKFESRKTLVLLVLLAVDGPALRREFLINLLWPEKNRKNGEALLRHSLYMLKKAIPLELFRSDRDAIALVTSEEVWIDLAVFRALSSSRCTDELTKAALMYRDHFLTGFTLKDSVEFDNWQRDRYVALMDEAGLLFERVVHQLRSAGERFGALKHCHRWLELDRLNENAHRTLMQLYAESGQRGSALLQYRECERILRTELNEVPGEETTALYHELRSGMKHLPPKFGDGDLRNNLPVQKTSFVGRKHEIDALWKLIVSNRLVTLTGSGGSGKTRLAVETAAILQNEFPDGVRFVELAQLADAGHIWQTLAGALGVREQAGASVRDSVLGYMHDQQTLIILDNCEHLLDACGKFVNIVMTECPEVRILATSREMLHLQGEHNFIVPPLSLPDLKASSKADGVSVLNECDSVRLFIDRATAIDPGFEVTNENAQAVVEICRRLDGLPLAIELAVPRIRLLPPRKMLERLDHCLPLLDRGARDLPHRQRTLWGAIDWSYDLLEDDEKSLFRRLSVFAGGCTLEAAKYVSSVPDAEEIVILNGIESLIEKSLLWQNEVDGEPRFTMLETIREYARQKLEESGESDGLRRYHAEYFVQLAERAEEGFWGPDVVRWSRLFNIELDNIRGAIDYGGDHEKETGLRIAGALTWYWMTAALFTEGRNWIEGLLKKVRDIPLAIMVKAVAGAALLASYHGDHSRALELCDYCLGLSREGGDKLTLGHSLVTLGGTQQRAGRLEEALKTGKDCVALSRKIGDSVLLMRALQNMGFAFFHLRNDYIRADAAYEESLAIAREIGAKFYESLNLNSLGRTKLFQQQYTQAILLSLESLGLSRGLSGFPFLVVTLETVALASILGEGKARQAAKLLGAAELFREEIGIPLLMASSYRMHDEAIEAIHEKLDESEFNATWQGGQQMSLDEAVEYALEDD